MRSLTAQECLSVDGAYSQSLCEGIMVASAFASIFSVAGATLSSAMYFNAANKAIALNVIFSTANSIPIITFPIALFAGIGFGGVVGATVGFGLYYTGLVTKTETV